MKKQIVRLTFILVLVLSLAMCSIAFYACNNAEEQGTVVQKEGASLNGLIECKAAKNSGKVDVTVDLSKNPGFSSLLLTLDYDASVLTFTSYDVGTTLASMKMLPTGSIDVTPFKFLYGPIKEKDTSTGRMLTLHFRIKTSAPKGTTHVGFTYKQNYDVYRLEESKTVLLNPTVSYASVTV